MRMRGGLNFLLGAMLIALAGCETAPLREEDYPRMTNGVVGPVPAAQDFHVTLETDGTVFPVGESVTIYYRIESRRRAPIFVFSGGDYRGVRQDRFLVTVTRADGTPAPDPFPGARSHGGRGIVQALERGKPWYEPLALPAYCQITQPGTYMIRVFHDLGWGERLTVNDLRDVSITLTFVEPAPERRQSIVDSIPEAVKSTGSVGLRQPWPKFFALLRNPAYLPELERRAMAGSQGAVIGISNITTREATAALLRLTEVDHDDVADLAWLCLCRRCPVLPADDSDTYYYPTGPNWWLDVDDFGNQILDLWPRGMMGAALDRARKVLREGTGRQVAFTALLVGRQGDRNDFVLLVAAFDRELDRNGGKDLETEWTVEWQKVAPIRYLLGGCSLAIRRGGKLSQSSRTPAEGKIAEYLTSLR